MRVVPVNTLLDSLSFLKNHLIDVDRKVITKAKKTLGLGTPGNSISNMTRGAVLGPFI